MKKLILSFLSVILIQKGISKDGKKYIEKIGLE